MGDDFWILSSSFKSHWAYMQVGVGTFSQFSALVWLPMKITRKISADKMVFSGEIKFLLRFKFQTWFNSCVNMDPRFYFVGETLTSGSTWNGCIACFFRCAISALDSLSKCRRNLLREEESYSTIC